MPQWESINALNRAYDQKNHFLLWCMGFNHYQTIYDLILSVLLNHNF